MLERSSDLPDLTPWIRPGDTIIWGQANAEPLTLTRALVAQRHRFARVRVFCGIGQSDTLQPGHADAIDFFGYTASGSHRALAEAGVLDILPGHYSQFPGWMRERTLPVDVVLVQVSPPDENGRHSLGMAHEYLLAALDAARVVIAEVHPDVPWVQGARTLGMDEIALRVDSQAQLPNPAPAVPRPAEREIGAHVAGLIEDGATLQIGIGNVPEAVLQALRQHRDLGLHTGAAGEGVAALAEAGVITNARKRIDPGVSIAGILIGGERLRRWAHRNPALQMRGTEYTHDHGVLASIDRLVAINSAIEVDLTGQINSEVAGSVYVGAVGGALDFMRGATASRGGRSIVALPSTAKGLSRIVASLSGPVSAARSDAGFIVTEHGVADLRGQPLSSRIRRLIDIAAPEHREALERQAHALLRRQGAVNF